MSAVRIIEVGPRDGLQYEKAVLSVPQKLEFIRALSKAGLKNIEAGSFVRADKVPPMVGSEEVAQRLREENWPPDVRFSFLVPNMKGLEQAMAAGVKEIAIFTAASDAFNQANINATIEESFARLVPVAKAARDAGILVRGYISTIFGGPKGEEVAPEKVRDIALRLLQECGVYEVSLGDTTGIGTPQATDKLLKVVLASGVKLPQLAMHLHDTGGRAIENVAVAFDAGVRAFDSAAGGLGGCPYADSPKGNLATEDLVWFLERDKGMDTGIDLKALAQAASVMLKAVDKQSPAKRHLQALNS